MRALVIGADGFVGRWLLRHLADAGDEVTAAVGPRYGGQALPNQSEPHPIDVKDALGLRELIATSDPEAIYYLAGVSQAGQRDDIHVALSVSVRGALNTFDAASRLGGRVRLLHVGTSHMYGPPAHAGPISDDAPLRPRTVYGAAKAAAEAALAHLAPHSNVELIAIRAFNHAGPGQAEGFVVQALAQQVAEAVAEGRDGSVIRAGNVDVRRDITDVRDVVRAYRLLALEGRPQTAYNVASGQAVSIRDLAGVLGEVAGIEVEVESDASLVRSGDAAVVVGDSTRLTELTGWRPKIPLRDTLRDVLADVVRVRKEA